MSVDRQTLFSGTEPPPPHLAVNLQRLSAYLRPRWPALGAPLEAVKFKGGQSNPTYLITAPGMRCVLRRKPPGALLASAHAIDREYRVMEALAREAYPVPRPFLYCSDTAIIGAEFYIAEFVEGRVFWEAHMPGVAREDRSRVYADMARRMACLHDLDAAALGLGDLGRAGGYLARNLARWSQIYEQSRLTDIPDMDWLIENLPRFAPREEHVAFIHGDYGLYNLIVAPQEPGVRAVLDWEMATLGDPFVDLAHHLRAWWEPPDERGAATSLVGRDLGALGIPSLREYVSAYCEQRRVEPPDMSYYLAHAQFRYACMIQGILKRAHTGAASSRTVLHRQERVTQAARLARQTLDGFSAP